MADNEKNMPIQDPENLENQINNPEETPVKPIEEIPVEETPVEEAPAEKVPAEKAPAEEAPTEETPVEEAPAEETPAEEAPAEEAPVEEAPAEEAPAEEAPAEEAPAEKTPTEEAPAEEAPVEETPVEETSVEETPVEENPVEENPVEEALVEETPVEEAPVEEAPVEETLVEETPVEEALVEETPTEEVAEEQPEDEDDSILKFNVGFDENGEMYIKSDDDDDLDEEDDSEEEENKSFGSHKPFVKKAAKKPAPKSAAEKPADPDPDDLIIHDEVVEAIKAEGARLTNKESSIKAYLKHSRDAVRNFEAAIKVGQRSLNANREDKETPAILVGIIKICAKILEIKSNVLENLVRVRAHAYVKTARHGLHYEIDRYNELVINYASLTGEQLTRLSTFLPENIASGKSLAVIPSLTYVENYVQIDPEEESEHGSTMKITPALTAEYLIGGLKQPKGRFACSAYIRKAKKAIKKLTRERTRINKQISDNKMARRRYESQLHSLEAKTPIAKRATAEYKHKVFSISVKYGQQITGIKTIKAQSAFARTRQRLAVTRLAIEREKLIIAYESMRVAYREGSHTHRRLASAMFEEVVRSYHQTAEQTSKITGIEFTRLPDAIVELTCRGEEITFPIIAYRRTLVENVADSSRVISMTLKDDVAPDTDGYEESASKVLEKHKRIVDTTSLTTESISVDRASAVAKVMLDALNESADMVVTADELEYFETKVKRAMKYFKRSLKATERAISRAFDEHGVITALVENLRVTSNIIEVGRLMVTVAVRLKRGDIARSFGKQLYKYIELYNGRAMDYTTIVGEQFSRITTATARELVDNAEKLKVPVITYKDNYIEVFPKDPLKDPTYEKPRLWRKGVYTPLLMHHYRLTENRAIETSVVNSPFVFDVMIDELQTISWYHPTNFIDALFVWAQPIVAWLHRSWSNIEIWFVDESLIFSGSGLNGRERKNKRKAARIERKIKRLNQQREAKILALETVVNESDRHTDDYLKQIYKINNKFGRKIYRLKARWMRDCTDRNAARLMLERLVLERERLAGVNKVLLKYRNYGRVTFLPNVVVRYKKKFIDAINAHNRTAAALSDMIGIQFSQVSTSVADEILRYGKMIKFPEIVCCREVIETIDGKQRTIGDRWHGYGLYTGTSGSASAGENPPIMSVGAMGYATNMGVPFLKADFDGMTMLGMTPGGVPLIGFSATGETSMPFTGTPMMLSGSDTSVVLDAGMVDQNPPILGAAIVTENQPGVNRRGVDSIYTDDVEEDAKDIHSGCEVETPLDIEAKMIEERFRRSLRARSMTSVDNTANWWKLFFSEINVGIMRKLGVRPHGFLRVLLPPKDIYLENVNKKVKDSDAIALSYIARVGGIIEIECKKLYSAAKTGIRRSQRVWSAWLHDDIEVYNKLVKEFNAKRPRHHHLELLSLNIPDTIRFRTEARPPIPQILSLRNRVKKNDKAAPITTYDIYEKLVEYAKGGAVRYPDWWTANVTMKIMDYHYKRGHKAKVLSIITRVILSRFKSSNFRRQDNEGRHYYIRYEKARSMKRYNKSNLRAMGIASDPIKYQVKVHEGLRKYLSRNFRIDYNMRIYQLIYRLLSIESAIYWAVTLGLAVVVAIAAVFHVSSPALQLMVAITLAWAALPIIFLLLRIVYSIVMFVIAVLFYAPRNTWLIKYGARDVERNRNGAILECFVTEQYRVLLACEKLRQKPKSTSLRRHLIASVNDYNKFAKVYSEILRVPINPIETTLLVDKITSGDRHYLPEFESFVYVRELVERVDSRDVGKTLKDRELTELIGRINRTINSINVSGTSNEVAVAFLHGAMEKFIGYIKQGIKPTQNDRYELKRDLIEGISQFDISAADKEIFAQDVIKVVDQLGGKDGRRIIAVLAEDNMF